MDSAAAAAGPKRIFRQKPPGPGSGADSASPERICAKTRPTAIARTRSASAPVLAEQHPAFHLVLLLGFDERHHHGAGLDLVILHDRVGDVLHEAALLIERAPEIGRAHV